MKHGLLVVLCAMVLGGCIHGGRDITGGGVTAFTGRTGVFDSGNTSYQHAFCEGGTQYEGDKPGLFVCAGGETVYKYANVTSSSILSQILSLGTPAAIAYAGHEIGKGMGDSGSTTTNNNDTESNGGTSSNSNNNTPYSISNSGSTSSASQVQTQKSYSSSGATGGSVINKGHRR